jgi:hypothetical protein
LTDLGQEIQVEIIYGTPAICDVKPNATLMQLLDAWALRSKTTIKDRDETCYALTMGKGTLGRLEMGDSVRIVKKAEPVPAPAGLTGGNTSTGADGSDGGEESQPRTDAPTSPDRGEAETPSPSAPESPQTDSDVPPSEAAATTTQQTDEAQNTELGEIELGEIEDGAHTPSTGEASSAPQDLN